MQNLSNDIVKEDKTIEDIRASVNAMFGGLGVFIGGIVLLIYSLATLYHDIQGEYTYSGTFTLHEYMTIVLIVVSFISIISGMIIVWSNKELASKEVKSINLIITISHILLAFVIIWAVISAIPYFYTCDGCGDFSWGYVETDLFGDQEFCYYCGMKYWSW